MLAPHDHDDFVPGETTLLDHTDGHGAATVVVKKPGSLGGSGVAWKVHGRTREHRNRVFSGFQHLNDSPLPLPNRHDKYVEDGGYRSFTIVAEGNKGWWVQQTKLEPAAGFKIPADLRFFELPDANRAA